MNRFKLILLYIISFIVFAPSCKLIKHKKSNKKKQETIAQIQKIDSANSSLKSEVVSIDTSLILKAQIDSLAPFWQRRFEFKTFSAKSKMHYEGKEKVFDFVANIRICKDSLIWVSINVAGLVQVARAIITPDSFKAILYTEKEVYEGPITQASSFLPEGIDFYSLQNLILGNPILNNLLPVFFTQVDSDLNFKLINNDYLEQLRYSKLDSTLKSSQLLTQGSTNKSLTHFLSNFLRINNTWIATERKINISADSSILSVDMDLSNISVDNELSYPFSIPKNYTRK
jgi:hypothetical protein